jgi:hypothetical protein
MINCIIAIYEKGQKKEPKPLGSGVLIVVKDEYYIATAAHVLENNSTENPKYYPLNNDFYPIKGEATLSIYNRNNIDIAIFKLEDNSVSELKKENYNFLQYTQNEREILDGSDIKNIAFVSSGFPGSKSKANVGEKHVKFQRLDLFTQLITNDQFYSLLGYNKKHFYLFDYPIISENGNQSPDPHGMSGGGLFEKITLNGRKTLYILRGINIEHLKFQESKKAINVAVYSNFLISLLNEKSKLNLDTRGTFFYLEMKKN